MGAARLPASATDKLRQLEENFKRRAATASALWQYCHGGKLRGNNSTRDSEWPRYAISSGIFALARALRPSAILCLDRLPLLGMVFASLRAAVFLWSLYAQAALVHFLRPLLFWLGAVPPPTAAAITASWLERALQLCVADPAAELKPPTASPLVRIASVEVAPLDANRGLSGSVCRLVITYREVAPGSSRLPATLIVKTNVVATITQRANALASQSYREGRVFTRGEMDIPADRPHAYYAYRSPLTGDLLLLLEDIPPPVSGANLYLGNQMWGAPTKPVTPAATPTEVLTAAFRSAAVLHAAHWGDTRLLDTPWLKAAAWYHGRDQQRWMLGLDFARRGWAAGKGRPGVVLSPRVSNLMERALSTSTWEGMQASLVGRPFTLTHGDFHASNMLVRCVPGAPPINRSSTPTRSSGAGAPPTLSCCLIDWSECGVWEPTADLGQMMISDVTPALRRSVEGTLVRSYWDELLARRPSIAREYPFARCWEDYKRSGFERWIWMLPVLLSIPGLPAAACQYFHDQMLSWLEDHGGDDDFRVRSLAALVQL